MLYAKVREIQDAQHLLATQTIELGDQPVQRASFTVIQGTGAFEGETTVFDPRDGTENLIETRGVDGRFWLAVDGWSLPGRDECWLDTTRGLARLGVDASGPGPGYQDLLASLLDHPANYRSGGGFYAAVDAITVITLLPPRAQALFPVRTLRRAAEKNQSVFVRSDADQPDIEISVGGGQLAATLGIEPDARDQLAQFLQALYLDVRISPGAQETRIEPPDPATVVRDPQACLPDDATT